MTRRSDLFGRHPTLFEPECDVSGDGHVRPQRVALEHHCCVALVRRQRGDVLVCEKDASGIWRVKTGDSAKQSRLSASTRTEQKKDLSRFDGEGNAVQRGVLPEPLHQVFNRNGYHRVSHWLIAAEPVEQSRRGLLGAGDFRFVFARSNRGLWQSARPCPYWLLVRLPLMTSRPRSRSIKELLGWLSFVWMRGRKLLQPC